MLCIFFDTGEIRKHIQSHSLKKSNYFKKYFEGTAENLENKEKHSKGKNSTTWSYLLLAFRCMSSQLCNYMYICVHTHTHRHTRMMDKGTDNRDHTVRNVI